MAWYHRLMAGLTAGLMLCAGGTAWAAIIPQYDMTLSRTRLVTSFQSALPFYSAIPMYLQLPKGTTSISTPTVVGNTAYQYTFDSGGTGYLSAIHIPSVTAAEVSAHATACANNQAGWCRTAISAAPTLSFPAGFAPSGQNEADGQDSLSTGPYTSITQGGTLAGHTAYQAIAIGKYLYYWPASQYQANTMPAKEKVYILGNVHNTDYQVDVSPLITPPVTLSGIDAATGRTVQWRSPVIVAESWDGGAVAQPVSVPPGVVSTTFRYTTSQTGPGGINATSYPHSQAPLTSDPTWVGSVPGLGSAVVAFGVAGVHPRVILWNVATGKYKVIGLGEIIYKVWDATLYDAANHTLYVQDAYGNLYAFNVDTGALTAMYAQRPGWTNDHSTIIAKDMALDGDRLYAVGDANQALGDFTLTLHPQHISDAYGPQVSSPAVLTASNNQAMVAINNASGELWLEAPEDLWATYGDTFRQNFTVPLGTTYVGFLPDASSQHDLIGWTNSDPDGYPALVVYVSEPYQVQVTATPTTVASGGTVTIIAQLSPRGITYDNGNNSFFADGTSSPVAYQVVGPQGGYVQVGAPMYHVPILPMNWQATWTLPPNTSLRPEQYTIIVTAFNEVGQMAQASVTITEDPAIPKTTASGSGALTLQCGWGGGGPNITVPHTCTIPASVSGNPPAWFFANPQYGVKFGDTIRLSLTIPPPVLPDLPGIHVDSVQVTATVPYTEGVPNTSGTGPLYHKIPATLYLTQTGDYTATGWLIESWAGYPPDEATANVGQTTMLAAHWKATVHYQYTESYSCGTAKHPATCSQTVYPPPITYRGTAQAPVTVNGTDYYEIATPQGNP